MLSIVRRALPWDLGRPVESSGHVSLIYSSGKKKERSSLQQTNGSIRVGPAGFWWVLFGFRARLWTKRLSPGVKPQCLKLEKFDSTDPAWPGAQGQEGRRTKLGQPHRSRLIQTPFHLVEFFPILKTVFPSEFNQRWNLFSNSLLWLSEVRA